MTSTRSWLAATLTAAFLAFGGAASALAQDKPKDESLEKLLEKLGEADKNKDADRDKPAAEPAKDEKSKDDKPKEPAQKETKPASAGKPKPTGEVAPKDQDLDSLLENLGKTSEKPAENDQKPGGAGGSDDSMPPRSDKPKPKPEDLNDGEKDVDKKLIEITGKKEAPKKNQKKGQGQGQSQGGDPESGPLGQVIKEMREVEERLGKPDTGEATRKKQTEIVKNLDQLIEQVKNSPNPSMTMKMIRGGQKPGNQPGRQPGDQTGAMAQGAEKTKPMDPKKPTGIAGLNKDVWGGLPANMRDLMGNAESELPLPAKIEMIRQYYLSLGNKSAKAGD